jgi:hypothetical protein
MHTMTKRQRFWFGIAFMAGAVVCFLSSIHLVDVPGEMTADKPEFLIESTTSLVIMSDIFGVAGLTCLLWKPKDRNETVA